MEPFKPNFFIIGAPRCGTTALSEYLRGHPLIGFSEPKETQFFATDMPSIRVVKNEAAYLKRCFGHIKELKSEIIGEGSVWHLYSQDAISNILSFNRQAKFVVMVRNPIELIRALHEKQLELLDEDCESLETAWRLQSSRRAGFNIPKSCREPKLLMYGDVGKLGEQIQRLIKLVPHNQVLVICFEDFTANTKEVYQKVLSFLGVDDDGRSDFPKINEGRRVKARWLYEAVSRPHPALLKIIFTGKSILGLKKLGVQSYIRNKLLVSRRTKPSVSSSFLEELRGYFAEDIRLLSTLINRDLSHWLKEEK
jgi:hypothetical protein